MFIGRRNNAIFCINARHFAIHDGYIFSLVDDAETVVVKINSPNHFITVRSNVKVNSSGRMFYKKGIPAMMNDAFEVAGLLFPKTPCTVVEVFGLLIADQDFFMLKLAGFY